MLKGLLKCKVLNSKEVRIVVELVKQQWGAELSDIHDSCGFLEGSDGDIFMISRDIEKLDLENLRVDSLGLYFGQLRNDELRLSIEGSQMVGKTATRNIVEIDDAEFKDWIRGNDLEKSPGDCSGNKGTAAPLSTLASGYVIIRHGSDFIGCGRRKEGKILNFVPKARRVAHA